MEPSYRIFLGRVIQLIDENEDFSQRLGISNQSYFINENEKVKIKVEYGGKEVWKED